MGGGFLHPVAPRYQTGSQVWRQKPFPTKNKSLALAFSLSHNSPWRPGHDVLNGDKCPGDMGNEPPE